jgi:hypothetical protein
VKFKEKFHPFDVVKSVGGIDSNFFDLTTLNIIGSMLDVKDVFVICVKDTKNHENKS